MTEDSLSILWNSIVPAAANHLWQSTLVAAAAGLLTLALRKYHARIRYGIWLASSLKFLVPFSALVAAGRYLAWSGPVAAVRRPALYAAFEEVAQPFAPAAMPVI